MIQNNLILVSKEFSNKPIKWSNIGIVVHELAELYQHVKEKKIDLIVVDESHVSIIRSVATRIRRHNGLTEIWSIIKVHNDEVVEDEVLDGVIPIVLGQSGVQKKINQILEDKKSLERSGLIGRTQSMKNIGRVIERIAPTEISVLVVGPSGSGKELVARALHDQSNRAKEPFVAINCGAISEGLLESELFGAEKGAFTGAVAKREGLFKKAEGGTIFLDEIGEMNPNMQVKLLRVLEDGTYYPVGASTPNQVNVRVIAATNRELSEAIAEKEFREDLYFRISAVKIEIPPLMDRRLDIQPIVQSFLSENRISDNALNLLVRYDWPGNVRQLRNFANRVIALKPDSLIDESDVESFVSEQQIKNKHLPVPTGKTVEEAGQELIYRAILSLGSEVRMLRDLITANLPANAQDDVSPSSDKIDSGSSMEEMELALIEQVLSESGGNRKEAARRLGIGERTLYRKLNKYNLR